jgi:hypothetical protein
MKIIRFDNFSIRQKIVISSILLSFVLFLLISPVGSFLVQWITPPTSVKNITVITKNNEIEISYSPKKEIDFDKYYIVVNKGDADRREIRTRDTRVLISDISVGGEYDLEIKARDLLGMYSEPIKIKVTPGFSLDSQKLNFYERSSSFNSYIIGNILIMSSLIVFCSFWIIGFKKNRQTIVTIVFFPTIAVLPLFLFISSVSFYINHTYNQFYFASIVSLALGIVLYLLFLTMNILFNAHFKPIPLEQAAKAAQFIFVLISTYIMLIYAFGSNLNVLFKLGLVSIFIFYFSYVSMWTLKELSVEQITLRSFVMVMIMLLSIVVFSIWPVNYIYAMLSSATIFYIMLSIGIEVRTFLGRYIWVEYMILIFLTTMLLFMTSVWGINGSIFF